MCLVVFFYYKSQEKLGDVIYFITHSNMCFITSFKEVTCSTLSLEHVAHAYDIGKCFPSCTTWREGSIIYSHPSSIKLDPLYKFVVD
jgi:hypothetical protein